MLFIKPWAEGGLCQSYQKHSKTEYKTFLLYKVDAIELNHAISHSYFIMLLHAICIFYAQALLLNLKKSHWKRLLVLEFSRAEYLFCNGYVSLEMFKVQILNPNVGAGFREDRSDWLALRHHQSVFTQLSNKQMVQDVYPHVTNKMGLWGYHCVLAPFLLLSVDNFSQLVSSQMNAVYVADHD